MVNAPDVLKYGNSWFLNTLKNFPEDQWEVSGVTGNWSAKDILSHIASYELILVNILQEFTEFGKSTNNPILDHQKFNDEETGKRRDKIFKEVLAEYNLAFEKVMKLIDNIPSEIAGTPGLLPWYGEEYSLDDYLVYTYYGHKREHGAQIARFKDVLESSK